MRKHLFIFLALIVVLSSGCTEASSHVNSQQNKRQAVTIYNPPPTPPPTLAPFVQPADIELQSTPGSSCFSHVGYDEEHEVLVVQFRDSGSKYSYSDFSPDDWDSFINAASLGKHYNSFIKGQFPSDRIY